MYAVIKTGGKQYRVVAGQKLKIEQIAADIGQQITLDEVLAVGSGEGLVVGTPLVSGASVIAEVLSQGRHDKVRIFKMRRRKHYQKRQGHRQNYTEILISDIAHGTQSAKASAAVAAPAKKAAKTKKTGDDLTIIEGIGPKIAELFIAEGITTFAQLADTSVERMTEILHAAGSRFAMHKPDTWAQQSALARDGKMDELKALQDELNAGKAE
ncbi:MAG: rplU [Burkholderiaceae bacterium]|nr:rplU [Burkholderiaceae bacterium]